MTTTLLDPATIVTVREDQESSYETTNEDGKAAHIVFSPDPKKSPQALVLEARIEGIEVEALCGYRWVPQQNPKALPVCQKCLEIYQQDGDNRDDREDLPDA